MSPLFIINIIMKKPFLVICCFILLWTVLAHQPRLSDETDLIVEAPEISKAYYKELKGTPHTYTITSEKEFDLYVNILVPKIEWITKDFTVDIEKRWASDTLIKRMDWSVYERTEFFELFGYDTYLMWPEYKERADLWTYQITVSNETNTWKYSLAIGEIESFDREETINAYNTIPKLKREFFWKSPISFIFSPLWYGLIIVMFILSFLFWFFYRWILKKTFSGTIRWSSKNIKTTGRLLRWLAWIALFVVAITTSRSPWLLFFSWFCFFEAIFSRCGFYAAIGKSSCPL